MSVEPTASPAPAARTHQEGPRKSFFSTVLGWFKSSLSQETAPAKTEAAPARRERGEQNNDRRRSRGGRDRHERGNRNETREGTAENGERPQRGEGRGQQKPRQPQREPKRSNAPVAETTGQTPAAAPVTAAITAPTEGQPAPREGGRSRRGRRGGRRDRGGRGFNGAITPTFVRGDEKPVEPVMTTMAATSDTVADDQGALRNPRQRRRNRNESFDEIPAAQTTMEPQELSQPQAEFDLPVAVQMPPAPADVVAAPIASSAPVLAFTRTAETVVVQQQPVSAPATSLATATLEVPAESGLVLVQTRKAAEALPDPEPEARPARRRTPRARPTPATEATPLVQVETQRRTES
ncbi:MAG: hypothetical protein G3I10_01890 [Ferrovum sp.]|nr:hypothetical protein [Ferrovum sp.]